MSRTSFRSFTPPKYMAHKMEEEKILFLEDRLIHFVKWLKLNGIVLQEDSVALKGFEPDVESLVKKYVES